jgi:3-deoxy-D-manno-octulosonic-acid transferase
LFYAAAIKLASLWNPKARLWVSGRKNWRLRYQQTIAPAAGKKRVWIHCASLGEFEQGRPVLEEIRQCHPDAYIVLSFFSPSGYEIRKHYEQADAVIYLPSDTPRNASDYLDIIQPDLAVFIKYEYWLNYLEEMGRRKIPVLMVSAIFRPDQVFFRWYGQRWRKVLHNISMFFVQNEASGKLLKEAGIDHFTVSGDTRFDRVVAVRETFSAIEPVAQFCGSSRVVVAGSTWSEDEEIWDHYANTNPETKFIIAPHEVYERHLKSIEKLFKKSTRYSELIKTWTSMDAHGTNKDDQGTGRSAHTTDKDARGPNGDAHVLIIDNIGLLSRLYHYADICYVGGGFGGGIHNILEAAVHGKPVIFGPEHAKFREAVDLIEAGAAFTVSSAIELEETVTMLIHDDALRKQASERSLAYVLGKSGATKNVLDFIQEKRLLTS